MRLTPSSTARRNTRIASSSFAGGPQIPAASQAHRSEAHPANFQIATNRKSAFRKVHDENSSMGRALISRLTLLGVRIEGRIF